MADQQNEHYQIELESEISKTFNKLYTLLESSDKIEADESMGHVAEGKAIWENDTGSVEEITS